MDTEFQTIGENDLQERKGLVGWWTFDGKDISGVQAYDRSGNGNRGILTSGPVQAIGKIGQALEFDGSNDFVDASATITQNVTTFTVAAWFKTTTVGSSVSIFVSKGISGQYAWDMQVLNFSGHVQSRTYNCAGSVINTTVESAARFDDGKWHHAVFVYNDTVRHDLYVDGIRVDTTTTFATTFCTGSTANLNIDARGAGGENQFKGTIDDVRVYNRALSVDEIKRLYNLGGTVKLNSSQNLNNNNSLQRGLVGWWTFDGKDISGVQAYDRSGSGNRGILTSGPVQAIGKIGQGLEFDGVDDYVNLQNPSSLNFAGNITISAWFKSMLSTSNEQIIIGHGFDLNDNITPWWLSVLDSTTVRWGYYDGQIRAADGTVSNLINQWHHAVGVFDGTSHILYIDGVKAGSIANTAVSDTSGQQIRIGAIDETPEKFFTGLIDDVRVYNRALSAEEIKRLYNMGR